MRVFGIDPGSNSTGYGCIDTDGRRHHLVLCGAIQTQHAADFPNRLAMIYRELSATIRRVRPECVAIEDLFHATNVRSALKLGHARGVAMLAAVEAGIPVIEYTPAEVKRAVVGYGRAEKSQIQQMVKLLLGLDRAPQPHDAADALAVAICHLHSSWARTRNPVEPGGRTSPRNPVNPRVGTHVTEHRSGTLSLKSSKSPRVLRSWRDYKPA